MVQVSHQPANSNLGVEFVPRANLLPAEECLVSAEDRVDPSTFTAFGLRRSETPTLFWGCLWSYSAQINSNTAARGR
jgi:hypothetical protein